MSSGKTNYLQESLLNHVLLNTTYTSPSAIYVALFTVAPTEAGGGTEVSGGGYVRKAATFVAPVDANPVGMQTSNSSSVDFGTASADWGTVVAFALFDAETSGNMLYWATLSTQRTINDQDQAVFSAGALVVREI